MICFVGERVICTIMISTSTIYPKINTCNDEINSLVLFLLMCPIIPGELAPTVPVPAGICSQDQTFTQ